MTKHWIIHTPLPMLGIAASYGVYKFATFFSPWPVAVLQALAFESVYIAVSFLPITPRNRVMAYLLISAAAATSILWNVLAGVLYVNGIADVAALRSLLSGDQVIALSFAHGVPLALIAAAYAYFVANMIEEPKPTPYSFSAFSEPVQVFARPASPAELTAHEAEPTWLAEARRLKADGMSIRKIAEQPNMPSAATVARWLKED